MVRPAIGDTAEVTLAFQYNGQAVENVIHAVADLGGAAWDSTNLTTLAECVRNWWMTTMRPGMAPNVVLQSIRAVDIGVAGGGVTVLDTTGLPAAGTAGSTGNMPNNVTIAISLRTGHAGRSHRGRIYHVGMYAGQLDSTAQQLSSGALAAFQTNYTALMNQLSACGGGTLCQLAVASWKLLSAFPVTGIQIDPYLDSQRRRLPFHNRHR